MANLSVTDVADSILTIAMKGTDDARAQLDSLSVHSLELSRKAFISEITKVRKYVEDKKDIALRSKVLQNVSIEDLDTLLEVISSSKVATETKTDVTFKTLSTSAAEYKDKLLQNAPKEKVALFRDILKQIQIGHESSSALTIRLESDIVKLNKLLEEVTNSTASPSIKSKCSKMLVAAIHQLRLSILSSTIVDRNKHGDIGDSATLENAIDFFNRKINYLSSKNFTTFNTKYLPTYVNLDTVKDLEKGTLIVTTSFENWLDNSTKGSYAKAINEATRIMLYQITQSGLDTNQLSKFKAYINRTKKTLVDSVAKLTMRERLKAIKVAQTELGNTPLEDVTASPSFKDLILNVIEDTILTGKPGKLVHSSKTKKSATAKSSNISISGVKIAPIAKVQKSTAKVPKLRNLQGRFTSVLNIESLIRAKLHDTIQKNMHKPALVYRTGRLANSVKLDRVENREGVLTAFLSYMKYPYATFEPGNKQGSKAKDPRRLIDTSVREIAKSLVTTRMKTIIA